MQNKLPAKNVCLSLIRFLCILFLFCGCSQENKHSEQNLKNHLPKAYSNSFFSINYPDSWSIVQEDIYATSSTTISISIAERDQTLPNINIIVSSVPRPESTRTLALITINQLKEVGIDYRVIDIKQCRVGGYDGTMIDAFAEIMGLRMHQYQYIVKKPDNATYTITMALNAKHSEKEEKLTQEIIESIEIF